MDVSAAVSASVEDTVTFAPVIECVIGDNAEVLSVQEV